MLTPELCEEKIIVVSKTFLYERKALWFYCCLLKYHSGSLRIDDMLSCEAIGRLEKQRIMPDLCSELNYIAGRTKGDQRLEVYQLGKRKNFKTWNKFHFCGVN